MTVVTMVTLPSRRKCHQERKEQTRYKMAKGIPPDMDNVNASLKLNFHSCPMPMDPSLRSIDFTPINCLTPSSNTMSIETSSQSHSVLATDEVSYHRKPGGLDDNRENRLKRNQRFYPDDNSAQSKRQLIWHPSSAFSPFQSLKATNCDNPPGSTDVTSNPSSGDRYCSTQTTKTTMDQLTSHPIQKSDQAPSNCDATNLYTSFFSPVNESQCISQGLSGLELTSNARGIEVPTCGGISEREHPKPGINDEGVFPSNQGGSAATLPEDEYPLQELLEEDMTLLLDTTKEGLQERHIPPSSVTQLWDHDSRSAVEFDHNLQYSSPHSSSDHGKNSNSKSDLVNGIGGPIGRGEDLLDEEVDWHAVVITGKASKATSLINPPRLQERPQAAFSIAPDNSDGCAYVADDSMALRPFPPQAISGETSDLPRLASNTLLRTCFRIGEMLSQTARCHKLQQEVVFELFARVTYSNREHITKKQHFQFVDLQKDQQPYPSGILTGWRTRSHLDRQSQAFANTKAYPKLCWCLCQPKRDPKAAIGWTYTIVSIKETDWRQVFLAKTILSGSDSGISKGALMARM